MIYFLLWYLSGLASFAYWWTFDDDLTVNEIPLLLLMGLFGVITFIIGVIIYFQHPVNYIIFRNRNRVDKNV